MQRVIKFLSIAAMLSLAACKGGYNGQLLGSLDRPEFNQVIPYGMVYIPSGTFHMGQNDEDLSNALVQRAKSVSIQGFFMDETEITNNEYRQFVEWIRDSVAYKMIGDDPYIITDDDGNEKINWEQSIDWEDPDLKDLLEGMYYLPQDRLFGRQEINVNLLWYDWQEFDYHAAARKGENDENRTLPRSTFITKHHDFVFPDTLCWVHDYAYSYNDPMTRNYFWHPAFDNYPVVGVNWKQARAFCAWRSRFWNDWRVEHMEVPEDIFRLPYEAEWEYAARGGRDLAPYPWGGPYMRNAKGCILANFKPGRGDYPDDGGFYTVKADAYFPNDYGLYNMAGNVSEWCSSEYYENSYGFQWDLNPDIQYDAEKEGTNMTMHRKVTRGGSWKDVAYYCQTGTRNYEYQDSGKCYVGFRCVMEFLGRSIND